ncbi:MAG: type II toxin-antitoxin system HipA family toxin [Marinospirillum sp.]|uniref:type II toxin-antitoxin system HipA family toxin n=1 Tax=Marinospirillum sp. TaxID=2183934 RepID=UPI001A0A137B|nr:type II toxin-antitoxin system HipA family toxin [Marinospirillum sp.]MBE0508972.1 type II toxin-antitoxin system HipA family toxin [Marinospirillum sp.]
MIDPDGLNVWSGQQLVGYLWRNTQGQLGFRYHEQWLQQGGFAISFTLPLQSEEFTPEANLAHRFFANLLPEGGARSQIVRDLKISNTDFDLLRAIGGECAGALSILQAEYSPVQESTYHQLTESELTQLVKRRGQPYSWQNNERPRLSLAGAQDKCPVLVRNQLYWLPKKESPTSHILKFELSDYRNLPAYETFTTQLAQAIELPAVNITLQVVEDTHFALIERYDRHVNSAGQLVRLHQEDFCQALGYGHERKYQDDGGPSFADCYRLLREVSTNPANDLQHLLHWQIFNVLAGNSDGHAKNLSLLYLPDGEIRLAPFYDLICTRAIERIDARLAFSVGHERNPETLNLDHWDALAKECGVRPRFLRGRIRMLAHALLNALPLVRNDFETRYSSYPALQRIEQIVTRQCNRALKQIT